MFRCRITVMRTTSYDDLMEKYENPIEHACDVKVGQSFISEDFRKPEGMCESAWGTMLPFVESIAKGEEIYEGWMKDPKTAMVSCNDGFRPVTFLIEKIE